MRRVRDRVLAVCVCVCGSSSGRSVSPSDATLRRLQSRLESRSPGQPMITAGGRTSPSVYFGQSHNGSVSSLAGP